MAISDPGLWRQAAAVAAACAAIVVRVLRPALVRADPPAPTLGRPAEFSVSGGWHLPFTLRPAAPRGTLVQPRLSAILQKVNSRLL